MKTSGLTPAQTILLKQFEAGRRIKHYNFNARNGGELLFTDNLELCNWRTFNNLIYALFGFGTQLTEEQKALFWA